MGLVLIGTVDSSYRVLQTLIQERVPIRAVLSLAAEDAKGVSDFADLGPLAIANGITHRYVRRVNDPEVVLFLSSLTPDVIFIIGWSQLVGTRILQIPRYGCVGAHPALLPKNRGRATIPWAIIQDEGVTGMSLFQIDEGTDSGDIIAQAMVPISDQDTAQTVYDRAVDKLCDMIRTYVSAILDNTVVRIPQNPSQATYCSRRRPEDGLIDWSASTRSIFNLIRAVSRPYPGAFTYYKNRRITVWSAVQADEGWTGVPGQILRLDPHKGALMKTADGTLWVTDLEVDGQHVSAAGLFKRVGDKLGLPDTLSLMRRIEQLEALMKDHEGK